MKNMSIKERLRLFPIVAIFIALLIAGSYMFFQSTVSEKRDISISASEVNKHFLHTRITVFKFLVDPKEEKANEANENFKTLSKEFSEFSAKLKVAENKERATSCIKLTEQYAQRFNEVVKLRLEEVSHGASEPSSETNGKIKEMVSFATEIEHKIKEIDTVAKDLEAEAQKELNIALIFLLLAMVVLPVLLGTKISSAVLESIAHLKKGFEVINNSHDTDHRLELVGNDEITEISQCFNTYMDKLNAIAKADETAINDISRVAKLMECGFVSVRINAQAGSPGLQSSIRAFNQALSEMEKATGDVAKVMASFGMSDFTPDIDVGRYSGEIGGMMTSLQGLSESMGDFMALLSKNGAALNSGATTLSGASGDLSSSSNTQASSLEETAAAIEELTSNISANSQKATQMAQLAQETQKAATDGKTLADSTVASMNEISAATQAINEAVDIIDNIAFQTNILSLNAAVEAATAGDAGKGFAVVAQEVRNLAGRSAEAAKQIKELAELANKKSSDGLSVSQDMMRGFDVINQKISQTTQLVQDVASGSREQMAGINQINTAVAQLDQMTQQNAGSANEVNKLADDILGMSQMLSETAAKTKYRRDAEGRVCRIDMMFETNKLKFDHVNFKNNNFAKLKDSITAWTVTTETQCDLGKWIAAHSNESYANGSEWNDLLSHHAHVHQKTQEYINREKAGASPEELCRIAKEIEGDTSHVFAGLNKLRASACAQDQRENMASAPRQQTRMAPPRHVAKPAVKSAAANHSDDNWDSF